MAFDAFVKIEGIEAESTDDKHQGWIEVLSCDVKVSQKVSHTASSAGGAVLNEQIFRTSVLLSRLIVLHRNLH